MPVQINVIKQWKVLLVDGLKTVLQIVNALVFGEHNKIVFANLTLKDGCIVVDSGVIG